MMLLILAGTFLIAAASLFFYSKDKMYSLFGSLLYVLLPYRIYVCYQQKNVSSALFWMLIPAVILVIYKVYDKQPENDKGNAAKNNKKSFPTSILWSVGAVVAIAAVSKTDPTLMLIFCIIAIVCGLFLKKYRYMLVAFLGLLASVPVNMGYWRFILRGDMNQHYVEPALITSKGYYFGHYFMSWVIFDDNPGLGWGLLLSLFVILWYMLADADKKKAKGQIENTGNADYEKICAADKIYYFSRSSFVLLGIAILLAAASYHLGIWDIAERIHPVMIRMISKIGYPNVFFGFATMILCALSAKVMTRMWDKEKNKYFRVIPISILAINAFSAIHLVLTLI